MKPSAFLVMSAILLVATIPANSNATNVPTKRPLDLPAGGPGPRDADEDAPEVIHFFGGEYEGDAFFWFFAAFGVG